MHLLFRTAAYTAAWLGAFSAVSYAQTATTISDSIRRIPLYATGNEAGRAGLYMSVSASVRGDTSTFTSQPTNIIVDTGSSELNLPITFFNFPGGKLPASYGKVHRIISYTNSSLWGVRIRNATVQIGTQGANAITIHNAPINIITQRCVGDTCKPNDVGLGIIGVNYQDTKTGSNVFRWADSPFNTGFLISTFTRDLLEASRSPEASTKPIGFLDLGTFSKQNFRPVQMTQRGTLTGDVPNGSSNTIWDFHLPGACLRINNLVVGFATSTQVPTPLSEPPSASTCQAVVVTDSGGRGGLIHFPGPLPAGVSPRGNRVLAVEIPGAFRFDFPVHPQHLAIRSNMHARNPQLSVNTGFRLFNHYDVYYDPISGIQGFRAKGSDFSGN